LCEPFSHNKGKLTVSSKPRLGFEIDEKALRRYGKRFFKMGHKKMIFHTIRDKGFKTAKEIDFNRKHFGVGATQTS